jgi:hypothetical protein
MTDTSKIHWRAMGLAFPWILFVWCAPSTAQSTDVSNQRRLAQEKYEKSILLCYQKFSVSDCKNDATVVLHAELNQLKKGEAEKMQLSRAQNAQEKVSSLSAKVTVPPKDMADLTDQTVAPDVKKALPAPKVAATESDSMPNRPSTHDEQAHRKRFEEKQRRAQQHRDAHEKRWSDKKSLSAAETPQTP